MEAKHWTQEQLLTVLYGVRSEEDASRDAHFSRCGECAARLRELRSRRNVIVAPVSLPENVVVAQRRAIVRRIAATRASKNSGAVAWWRPMAAFAAVAMLLIAIAVRTPVFRNNSRVVSIPVASQADAKFFNEVMYEASRTESAALTPLHNLFESGTQTRAVKQ